MSELIDEVVVRPKRLPKKKMPNDIFKMTPEEQAWLIRRAVFLRAAGKSPSAISMHLRVGKTVLKSWFDDEEVKAQIALVHGDIIEAGINLIETEFVGLMDNLVSLAYGANDDKVKLQATIEAIGICGVTKVNRSQTIVTQKNETDADSLLQRVADLPAEKQQAAARAAEAFLAHVTEQPV